MTNMRPRSAAGKTLSSGWRSALTDAFGVGLEVGILAQVHDQVAAGVGRQDDDRVLEIDEPAFAVFHPALVEDLEKNLVHVGMRLFDFVEQDHAVGPPPHGFGEHAAFAVADVAGRRTLERGDGVRLLELAHVDRDQAAFVAEERLGQGQRGFGFADAARARRA